ncbi:unnamed protein product, partial [Rangifer tarandus platyrhynchus]
FSMYSIMSSTNSEHITSFAIWILFISFSSMIDVTSTFKSMLNNDCQDGNPYLIPDLQFSSVQSLS